MEKQSAIDGERYDHMCIFQNSYDCLVRESWEVVGTYSFAALGSHCVQDTPQQ
jgi:hypothetical protein